MPSSKEIPQAFFPMSHLGIFNKSRSKLRKGSDTGKFQDNSYAAGLETTEQTGIAALLRRKEKTD